MDVTLTMRLRQFLASSLSVTSSPGMNAFRQSVENLRWVLAASPRGSPPAACRHKKHPQAMTLR